MLEEIGSYDAKTKLSEILRRVENGEGFTITNRGKPVADLIPSQAESRSKAKSAINNILRMKRTVLSEVEFNELKEEGRK